MRCVEEERLKQDILFIAQPRPPKSAHWQAVQDLCASRFQQYGFTVELHRYATGVNVIGRRQGKTTPSEQVVVSAHYDHIADCAGADDNATGVAALLETARVFEHLQPARSLVLACWDEEELGLIGSAAYAKAAKERGDDIVSMVSLETMGVKSDEPNSQAMPAGFNLLFGEQFAQLQANDMRADFVAIIGNPAAQPLATALQTRASADQGPPSIPLMLTEDQTKSALLIDLRRSDHASFWAQGYPGVMLTDTANFRYPQYHCLDGNDEPELLHYGFLTSVTRAHVGATVDLLGL